MVFLTLLLRRCVFRLQRDTQGVVRLRNIGGSSGGEGRGGGEGGGSRQVIGEGLAGMLDTSWVADQKRKPNANMCVDDVAGMGLADNARHDIRRH
jgi:hypothetical protein